MKRCFSPNLYLGLSVCILAMASGFSAENSPSAAKQTWIKFEDPSEHAFTLEVPQGWEAKGGMYRFGYFDVRWMMDVRSPDGKVILRVDDASIPPYALPGPHTGAAGQPYNKPQQFQMMVEDYRNGQAFAETYAQSRFKSACLSFVTQPFSWKPVMPTVEDIKPTTVTEGSVSGACNGAAGARIASVYARTNLFREPNGVNFWVADPVLSAVTTSENVGLAQAVAQHMLSTFQKNPKWDEYQKQMTQAGLQSIQRNFQQFMTQMQAYHQARSNAMNQQVAGFEARQNAKQAQFESWDEAFVGLTKAVDPMTGREFQVWSGPNANYYRNGVGDVVNSNTNPGGNYQQLQVPPQ
jgi:hypothetical protein